MSNIGTRPAPNLYKTLFATCVGNALEWFDIAVYAFFARYIAHEFFPTEDPSVSMLLTFGSFGVSFLIRPLGAIVLGAYADRGIAQFTGAAAQPVIGREYIRGIHLFQRQIPAIKAGGAETIRGMLVMFAPFFIYVFGPLLQFNILMGSIAGGIYLGFIYNAGAPAIEAYIEKVSRRSQFEFGRARMFGCVGWALCASIAGIMFTIDNQFVFWLGSAEAICG